LIEEDAVRRSGLFQTLMEQAEKSEDTDWMELVSRMQEDIVEKALRKRDKKRGVDHGLRKAEVMRGVGEMRRGAGRHPAICHYVKYNISREGDLVPGSTAPDLTLRRAVDRKLTSLLGNDTHTGGSSSSSGLERVRKRPLVLLAGSYS